MTCIVALLEENGNVVMGGDSASVSGVNIVIRSDEKVFTRDDELGVRWAFGFTTSFRMGQLLKYEMKLPRFERDDLENLHKYMVTKFIKALRECLKEGGWLERRDGRETGGTFIVGVLGEIFVVETDYQVSTSMKNYAAVGLGADHAMSSLFTSFETKPDMSGVDRVELALRSAEMFIAGVDGPFKYIETGIPIIPLREETCTGGDLNGS